MDDIISILKNDDCEILYELGKVHITKEDVDKYADVISDNFDYLQKIFKIADVSEEFIENYAEGPEAWYDISMNSSLTENFIANHAEEVCWINIVKYQDVSDEFLMSYSRYICNEIRNGGY